MTFKLDMCLFLGMICTLHVNLLESSYRSCTFNSQDAVRKIANLTELSPNIHEQIVTDEPDLVKTFQTLLSVSLRNSGYTWSKNVNLQISYCTAPCYDDTLLDAMTCSCSDVEWFSCDCNRPHCDAYVACCPSLNNTQAETESTTCISRCDNTSVAGTSFLYIRSCPQHFSDHHVVAMCTDNTPAHELTTESFVRAHDNSTGVVYYNKYCARCNNVSEPTMWDVTINCENYLHVYTATTRDELLRLSLKVDSTCRVYQTFPHSFTPCPCSSEWHGQVINSCSAEQRWPVPEDDAARRCGDGTKKLNAIVVVSGHTSGRYYSNVFCDICSPALSLTSFVQDQAFPDQGQRVCFSFAKVEVTGHSSGGSRGVLPFSLLLGSVWEVPVSQPPDPMIETRECPTSEWSSPDNKCLTIQCSPGKQISNRTCVTAVNSVRGLAYIARVLYRIESVQWQEGVHAQSEALSILVKHLQSQKLLDPYFAETQLEISCLWQNCSLQNTPFYSDLDGKVGLGALKREDHEVVNTTDFIIYMEAGFVANHSFPRDEFEHELLAVLLLNVTEVQAENISRTILTPIFEPGVSDFVACWNEIPGTQLLVTNSLIETTSYNMSHSGQTIWSHRSEFLTLSPVLTCTHVSFNQSEYTLSTNGDNFPDLQVSLNLGHVTLTFSDVSDLNRLAVSGGNGSTDGQLKVCVDLLEEKVQELKDRPRLWRYQDSAIYLWLYYLTQVCIGLSMICLMFTLLTFSLFPPLRNNAGTNNMFLSGTILLAQASLLSSVHVDGPNWLCTTLGISTHFLWLSLTYWSFICCLHMFRVFTSKTGVTQSSAASQKISLIKKVLASILTPTVVIATVIASSYLTSGGQRIGYTDSNPCYLDSSLVTLLSLVAPLGIVCVVNCCFFATAVYKIHQVRKLQSTSRIKRNDRDTFTIYIKLSTLTGSFWIIAIVSEKTGNDPLRFIAVILNGLQGVFLFMSFICTKRVLKVCFKRLLRPKRVTSTKVLKNSSDATENTSDMSSVPRKVSRN